MTEDSESYSHFLKSVEPRSKQYTAEYASLVQKMLAVHLPRIEQFRKYKPKQEGSIPNLLVPSNTHVPYVITPHGDELNILEPVKQCTKFALSDLHAELFGFIRRYRIIESSPDVIEKFMALDVWDQVFEYEKAVISPEDYITLAGLGLLKEPFLIPYSTVFNHE